MTKRVFRSIFLASLAVLLAAVVLILGALYTYFSDVQAEQLRLQTALVAHALETEGVSYFDDLDTSDRRITWIAADGTVLYDSRSDSGVMENHLEREEVKAALATGSGTSFRYSDTLMERYIYTAQRLSDGTVLRLSAAQNTVPHLVLGVVKPIILVIGIAVALSALLAGQLTKNIVAPLNELNLDDPMSNREYVEIQPLLRRLDSQQVQLRAQSQELRQKQKEFNTVTRSLSEGLVLMNSSGTVLSINPAATRLLEITPGWGEGVRTMREGCIQAGAELPNFDLSPEHTAVVFPLPATKRGAAAVRAKAGGKTRAEGGRDRKATAPQATGDGARRATFAERSLAAAHKLDMTQTDEYVLQVLTTNGRATAVRIAQALGVSERTVRRSFKKLRDYGFIERIGSDKAGYWSVTG